MTHTKKNIHPIIIVWRYIEPLWIGRTGKMSIRNVLAMFFSWKLIENLDYGVRKWDAGRNLGDLTTLLLILAGLIAGLLSLNTYQSVQTDRMNASMQAPPPINVQKAETVNTDNIETVNTGTINTAKNE